MKYVLIKYADRVSEIQELTDVNEGYGYTMEVVDKHIKFTQPIMFFNNGIPDWAINRIPIQILCKSCAKKRLPLPESSGDQMDKIFTKWTREGRKGSIVVTDADLASLGQVRIGEDMEGTVYTCGEGSVWIIKSKTRREVLLSFEDINVLLSKFL